MSCIGSLGQQRKEEEYLRSNRTYKKRMDG